MATQEPEPFSIVVADEAIEDLRARLKRARFAPEVDNADWRYGLNGAYLSELVDYWIGGYDWRAAEAEMNRYAHYQVRIDDLPVHYLHRRGVGPSPMPLILSHGWPWTFWDYHAVIDPLADPVAHGGDPADAFDVVVVSLPGFGFSSPLEVSGVHNGRIADTWHTLMTEVLGYERYAAGGGDWGALITAYLGHKYAESLAGIHVSFPALVDLDYMAVGPDDYGPGEEGWWDQRVAAQATATSHMMVHSIDPQTLAWALNDSPVGLAAWIIERRRNWSDCGGDVEAAFTRDHLLTTVSIYWFTQTIASSMRLYWENARHPFELVHDREPAVQAPTGMAIFPKDVLPIPRRIAEAHANLHRWSVMPSGGHFGPAEEPELYIDDIRAFYRPLR